MGTALAAMEETPVTCTSLFARRLSLTSEGIVTCSFDPGKTLAWFLEPTSAMTSSRLVLLLAAIFRFVSTSRDIYIEKTSLRSKFTTGREREEKPRVVDTDRSPILHIS